jgi:hypothetical protein
MIIQNKMKSLKIISLMIPLIAIIGIMSFAINDININQVFGQTNDSNNKTDSQNSTDTFDMKGAISSLVFMSDNTSSNSWNVPDTKKFVLSGDWSLAASNGKITNLYAKFTKVLADGTRWHSHEFINFKTNESKIMFDPEKNLSVSGIADVKLNNQIPYNNTNINITISKGDTIKFKLDNEDTGNHFFNQPIYGIVKSIIGKEGNKIK